MRAVSEDRDAAALMGIDANKSSSSRSCSAPAWPASAACSTASSTSRSISIMGFLPGDQGVQRGRARRHRQHSRRRCSVAFSSGVVESIGPPLFLDGLGIPAPYQLRDLIAFTLLVMVLVFRPSGAAWRETWSETSMRTSDGKYRNQKWRHEPCRSTSSPQAAWKSSRMTPWGQVGPIPDCLCAECAVLALALVGILSMFNSRPIIVDVVTLGYATLGILFLAAGLRVGHRRPFDRSDDERWSAEPWQGRSLRDCGSACRVTMSLVNFRSDLRISR